MPTGTTGGATPTTATTPATTGATDEKWKPGKWILATGLGSTAIFGVCYLLAHIFGNSGGTVDVNHHIDGEANLNHNGVIELPVNVSGNADVTVRADTASWSKVCRECQEEKGKAQKKTSKSQGRGRSGGSSKVEVNINNNNGEGTQTVCGKNPSDAGGANVNDGGVIININNNNGGKQCIGGGCKETPEPKLPARNYTAVYMRPCH